MEWTEIGSRIRRQREYPGCTQDQFAEMLEVTPKFCSNIELGVKGSSAWSGNNIKISIFMLPQRRDAANLFFILDKFFLNTHIFTRFYIPALWCRAPFRGFVPSGRTTRKKEIP